MNIPTLAGLLSYHVATPTAPRPTGSGVAWLWAQNGVFKRGANQVLELVVQVGTSDCAVPGLASLLPSIRWFAWPQRIPGVWLTPLLQDAQQAAHTIGGIARPIEKQYFVLFNPADQRLVLRPAGRQLATAARVHYEVPVGVDVLVDIHSHHGMPAFFSSTDDADDTGLSVSVVIGRIHSARPEIMCRLNVYGHHQVIPALMIFDSLGPFQDVAGVQYADTDY
jgi:PRTRC genetic system protein A